MLHDPSHPIATVHVNLTPWIVQDIGCDFYVLHDPSHPIATVHVNLTPWVVKDIASDFYVLHDPSHPIATGLHGVYIYMQTLPQE